MLKVDEICLAFDEDGSDYDVSLSLTIKMKHTIAGMGPSTQACALILAHTTLASCMLLLRWRAHISEYNYRLGRQVPISM